MGMRTFHAIVSRLGLTILTLAVLLTPGMVWAQSAPTPQIRNSPKPWIGLMCIFLLLALMLAVSLMPSKRGHQD
jgi:FtsH-binding integral membrane protein